MIRKPVVCLLLLLLVTSLACNFATELLEDEPTLAPPPTVGGATVPAATAPAAEETVGPAATPTLVGEAPLPELGTPPETVAELAPWLGGLQAAEQPLADVCAALQSAGWQQAEDSCQDADLDDDEEDEWLLTLDFSRLQAEQGGASPLQGHPGDLWVVRAGQVVYQTQDAENPDFFGSAPQVFEVADMTGDEQPEVITLFTTCGAHTCFNNYQILSAHNGPVQNVISLEETAKEPVDPAEEPIDPAAPETISMAYVDEEALEDATDDDLPDLIISGGLIGSAGAGIQRPRTEIWAWDGTAVGLDEIEWADTGYRFHLLYNANYAFAQEAYDVARDRYEAVVVDPALEEVDWPPSPEAVRAAVRQFAGFRLTLLPLFRGDITEATRWQDWLQSEYPDAPLTEAAARLIPEWQGNGNDLDGACATVTAFLEQHENPTGPLTNMGYGNPVLEAEDVCPLE